MHATRQQLTEDLRRVVRGEVYDDAARLGMFATDASIHQQMPRAVVAPMDARDVAATRAIAARHGIPIVGRGGGTSLAGQAIGNGITLDFTRHLRLVEGVDPAGAVATVQPGVVRDELNAMLAPHGLMFAPETSTSNRATVGGMVGNNSSGMMSIRYGRTSEHIRSLRVLLADGVEVTMGPGTIPPQSRREEELRRALLDLADRNRALIESRWPRVLRRVGGYSLDELLRPAPNFARFLAGSEGTLAITLGATLDLVHLPGAVAMMAVHYSDFIGALESVPAILAHDPLSVELLDRRTLRLSRTNSATRDLCGFIKGDPACMLQIEATGASMDEARAALDRIAAALSPLPVVEHIHRAADAAERAMMIELRRAGLGVTMRTEGDAKPVSFIEDAAVPGERLAQYMREMTELISGEGLEWVVYGHASVGVLHFKPILNLKSARDIERMQRLSRAAMERVREFGGSWSGEHGDGILRGWLNRDFWGPAMYEVFREVKRLFDPKGLLNPGRIVDTPSISELQRTGPSYRVGWQGEHFHFRAEGGFAHAVEMCNGTGACRKRGSGTMCPSYMATMAEEHSTRGRANALRLAMSGQLGADGLDAPGLRGAMDLCLECKACKAECPSNVDMAKMKSELLSRWNERDGVSPGTWMLAHQRTLARHAAGRMAPVANGFLGLQPVRKLIERAFGISASRTLPRFAARTFSDWWRSRPAIGQDQPDVILFIDTYTEYYSPAIGRAAVEVMEACGLRVRAFAGGCCARPLMSKGFLDEAASVGGRTMRGIASLRPRGVPVVVLEPSCLSAFRDDLPDLLDESEVVGTARDRVQSFEEFIAPLTARLARRSSAARFLLHGHCHQKALWGTTGTLAALRAVGACEEIPSGCCGMAGSFGYEVGKAELSLRIGEDRLFPAVRSAPRGACIVAPGFSCRHQIADGAGRRALHPAEAIRRALGA